MEPWKAWTEGIEVSIKKEEREAWKETVKEQREAWGEEGG